MVMMAVVMMMVMMTMLMVKIDVAVTLDLIRTACGFPRRATRKHMMMFTFLSSLDIIPSTSLNQVGQATNL